MSERTVAALLDTEHLSPAYALAGAQAPGLARRFIHHLFCPAACGRCAHCTKLERRTHPDVFWLRAQGKNIKLDQVRALQRRALYPPSEASHKVFVIEAAEQLSLEAANSLLKILEDPPRYAVFLLLTQRLGELLPTVRSRCRVVRDGGGALDDAALRRACWGDSAWLGTFPIGEGEISPPASSVQTLGQALSQAEDVRELYLIVSAAFRALPGWSLADALQLSAFWAKTTRDKVGYALCGLTHLCHGGAPEAQRALRKLSLSYGALRANANVHLLLDVMLIELWQLFHDGNRVGR